MENVWLVSEGRVLASAVRATTHAERRHGLIGAREVERPLVLDQCSWVHSIGMRTDLDVAYVDADDVVISTAYLRRWRVPAPVRGARRVVEAAPGSFERWNLRPGDVLEIRTTNESAR